MGNIELKTYAGANVTPQNDAIMNDANTMNNGIYYGCNVTIKDATTLHITAGQGIIYGRVFEVVDSDISVSLSSSGTLLGQLFVRLDLGNISSPAEILVDTGASLTPLVDDDQINIDAGITEMQLATFKVNTITLSDLAETFASVQPIRAVIGNADISAIGDGSVKGAIRTINTHLTDIPTIESGVVSVSNLAVGEVRYIDVTFTKTFAEVPNVVLTEKGVSGGQTFGEVSATKTGFRIFAQNSANVAVSYSLNWIACL